jgi:hypothetical protein
MTDSTPLDLALQRMQAAPDDAAARLSVPCRTGQYRAVRPAGRGGARGPPAPARLRPGRGARGAGLRRRGAAGRVRRRGGGLCGAAGPGAGGDAGRGGEGLSLIVNAGAEHAELLPPEALDWLAATLAAPPPAEGEAMPEAFAAPTLPAEALDLLVPALERRLSGLPGLEAAVLAAVRWQGGARGTSWRWPAARARAPGARPRGGRGAGTLRAGGGRARRGVPGPAALARIAEAAEAEPRALPSAGRAVPRHEPRPRPQAPAAAEVAPLCRSGTRRSDGGLHGLPPLVRLCCRTTFLAFGPGAARCARGEGAVLPASGRHPLGLARRAAEAFLV